jgi:protein-tyrosine phosphatase
VDLDPPGILVVCTGNICRSPYVEHLLRTALDRAWGTGEVTVTSAGTQGLPGWPVSPPVDARLGESGQTARGFASRRLEPGHLRGADLVLTATKAHRGEVVRMHPGALRRAFTVRELGLLGAGLSAEEMPSTGDAGAWLREVTATLAGVRGRAAGADLDVVDPYRRDQAVYDAMFDQVQDAWPGVVRALTGRTTAS